jgi:hypothetical protein
MRTFHEILMDKAAEDVFLQEKAEEITTRLEELLGRPLRRLDGRTRYQKAEEER